MADKKKLKLLICTQMAAAKQQAATQAMILADNGLDASIAPGMDESEVEAKIHAQEQLIEVYDQIISDITA